DADFFYSDEDKCMTGKNGKLIRFDPHFKPDFAPDALNSNNYICHFSMLKKALFKNLGGFHSGYDGAQDHDLFLRASEKTDKFVHIPDVLYHWRVHAGSTAGAAAAKEYAAAAGVKAVQNHLDRLGLPGHVTKDRYGTYDVRYAVTGNPSVTILIPRNSLPALKRCIDSLLTLTTYENYRIAVIENNSTDEQAVAYYGQLAQNPRIQILRCPEKDVNHAAMIHFGVHSTVSDFVLQLSNDTELLTPDWLQLMLGFAQRKGTGAVGVKLLYPDRTIQHAGIVLGVQGIAGYAHKGKNGDHPGYFCRAQTIQDVSAVTTACLMAKREVYERIDDRESALPPLLGDVDFCLKIRSLGERIVYLPTVELLHYDSKSGDADDAAEQIKRFPRETRRFLDKWGAALDKGDPYYNPNLSLANSDFRITPHPAVRFPLCLPKE
ncbi:MAG: glycosyltransferase, partial [Oscillospiraceae bacterium]|nr:glycosyltransferase [Oscillospiraceae bacterium]